MGMGNKTAWVSFAILMAIGGVAKAGEQLTIEDVQITKVYAPTKGFDDNDQIEVVTEGVLPNPCYTLAKTIIGPKVNNSFMVRQTAWRSKEGACNTGDLIDDPVPYISVGVVGQLNKGDYAAQFTNKGGELDKKVFNVEEASSKAVDNFDYAAIQNVDAKEIFYEGTEVVVTLNGVWTTKCQEFKKPIAIEKQDDVFLVLPILKQTDDKCEKGTFPVAEKVSLGKLAAGTYLVHSRSRGGKAIYRQIQVWPHLK